jgi:hypothetical protein
MGWISKSWAFKGQLLPMAKRADPPKSKLFGAVTHLESSLTEFNHPLDQCRLARHQFRLLSLIIHMRQKEVFVHTLRFSMSINKEPFLGGAFPATLECGIQVFLPAVAVQ